MDNDLIQTLISLPYAGFITWLYLRERARSTVLQDARVEDLKARIAWCELRLPTTPSKVLDTPSI